MRILDALTGSGKEKDLAEEHDKKEKDFIRENQLIDATSQNEQVDIAVQDARSDLLKWQQDLDDELEKLKHRLRSEVKNRNGEWVPKLIPAEQDKETGKIIYMRVPPLANEIFIDYIQTQVEPFLSRNMFSSNFDQKRILDMLKNTCNDIADNMADGWDNYGMEFVNFDLVVRLIKNVIIPGPFRALNDGQRRHDRTVAKRIEAFNDRETQRKQKSIMGVNVQ